MNSNFEYSTLINSKTAQRLTAIFAQCFNGIPEDTTYFDRVGKANFRIVLLRGKVIGGLALLHMGQWFNGQCVPMTGIASVGVAPEYRRSGAASFLMQHVIKELYDNHVYLSVLYPSTQQLYRNVGYEQAGTQYGWEQLIQGIEINQRSLPIEQITCLDRGIFNPIYEQQAKLTNGHMERNSVIWESLFESEYKKNLYGYLLGSISSPEGYFIYSQNSYNGTSILQLEDWVTLTTAAAERLWTFIADHASQIQRVHWKSSAVDALTLVLRERAHTVRFAGNWMLRVVDVKGALEKRGYPRGIERELHLRVDDALISENCGNYILSVADGTGSVTPGGRGDIHLNISALAPLFTGLFTPLQLKTAGLINSHEKALLDANAVFAGVCPWMPDVF